MDSIIGPYRVACVSEKIQRGRIHEHMILGMVHASWGISISEAAEAHQFGSHFDQYFEKILDTHLIRLNFLKINTD